MTTKTPRQLLHETLDTCSREVATWPAWMRSAVSMANVFNPAPPTPKVTPEAVLATLTSGGRTLVQIYDALKCTELAPLGLVVWRLLEHKAITAVYHIHSPHEGRALLAVITDLDALPRRMTDTSCDPPIDFDVLPDDIEVVFSLTPRSC